MKIAAFLFALFACSWLTVSGLQAAPSLFVGPGTWVAQMLLLIALDPRKPRALTPVAMLPAPAERKNAA